MRAATLAVIALATASLACERSFLQDLPDPLPNNVAADDRTPPGDVQDLRALPESGSDMELSWTAPGGDGQLGDVFRYVLGYVAGSDESDIGPGNFRDIAQVPYDAPKAEAGQEESFTITGLEVDTSYCFALVAYDVSENQSGLSNVVCSKTVDDAPPDALASLDVAPVALGRRLAVSWSAPVSTDAVSVVIVRGAAAIVAPPTTLREGFEYDGKVVARIAGADDEERAFTDAGLEDGVEVYYAAFVLDDDGQWSHATGASGTPADATAPQAVSVLTAIDALDGRINLTWITLPDAPDYPPVRVLVVRRQGEAPSGAPVDGTAYQAGDALGDGDVVFAGFGSVFTDEVPSLRTQFHYRAFAYDAAGNYADEGAAGFAQSSPSITTPPAFFAFQASSSYAKSGDEVSLSFESTKVLPPEAPSPSPNPSVSFAGAPMSCSATAERGYLCSVTLDDGVAEGTRIFQIEAADALGNQSGPVIPPLAVVVDNTAPVVAVAASPVPAIRGEAVTFQVGSDEDLGALPEVLADWVDVAPSCTGVVPGRAFSCVGARVSTSAAPGAGEVTARGVDRAGNEGTSELLSVALRDPAPTLTFVGATPDPARAGVEITIDFASDVDLSSCSATVANRQASCAPDGASCGCTLPIDAAIPDGPTPITLGAANATGTGQATGYVQIDNSPPKISAALLAIARNGRGVNEQIASIGEGAVVDDGVPYDGRAVAELRVWSDAADGTQLAALDVGADGAVAAQDLLGTEVSAPPRAWVSAVDMAGNESGRLEIENGRSLDEGPIPGTDSPAIVRTPPGSLDEVAIAAGVFVPGVCMLSYVEVFAPTVEQIGSVEAHPDGGAVYYGTVSFDPRVTSPFGTAAYDEDAGALAVPVGTPTSSYRELGARAVDKCGGASAIVHTGAGNDWRSPRFSPSALVLTVGPLGVAESLRGEAGAVVDDDGAAMSIGAYTTRIGGSPLASASLAADGSFAPLDLGDVGTHVYVEAVDKAGNVSAHPGVGAVAPPPLRPRVRRVEATFTVAGRVRHDDASTPLRGHAFAAADPRALAPGVAAALAAELDDGAITALSAADADRAVFAASSTAATSSAAWLYEEPQPRVDRVLIPGPASVLLVGGDACCDDLWQHDGTSWIQRETSGGPGARATPAAAFDATQGKVLLYGGANGATALDDTWELDVATWTWTSLGVSGAPGQRAGNAMVYVAHEDRFLMWGPDGSGAVATWSYDASSGWAQEAVAGPSDVDLDSAAAKLFYDATAQRTFLVGLRGGGDAFVYELTGATWTDRAPSAGEPVPPGIAFAYDEVRSVIVGVSNDGWSSIRWELSPLDAAPEWQLSVGDPEAPEARSWAQASWHPALGAVALYGGRDLEGGSFRDLWSFDGDSWLELATPVAPEGFARRNHMMAYDMERGGVVMFGGCEPLRSQFNPPCSDTSFDDAHLFDGSAWVQQYFSGATRRSLAGMTYDTGRGRLVSQFGFPVYPDGWNAAPTLEARGGAWEWADMPLYFYELNLSDLPPPWLGRPVVAYDAARARVLMVGGWLWSEEPTSSQGDLWSWDGESWRWVSGSGVPLGTSVVGAYAAARDRLVVVTGADGATWEYDDGAAPGARWQRVGELGISLAGWPPAASYDARRDRVVVEAAGSTWEWDGATWTELAAGSPGTAGEMAYDLARHEMVYFGDNRSCAFDQCKRFADTTPRLRLPRAAERQTAAHSVVVPLSAAGATAGALSVTVVAAGSGDGDGDATADDHVEVLVWSWAGAAWEALGTHQASDADDEAARTITASPSGDAADYVSGGALWLLVTTHPSSPPGAGTPIESRVATDYVEVALDYQLP